MKKQVPGKKLKEEKGQGVETKPFFFFYSGWFIRHLSPCRSPRGTQRISLSDKGQLL